MSVCQHSGCDAVLSRRNRSGYCKHHVSAVNAARPEFAEKIREGIKRKAQLDPAFADGMRQRARAINSDPDIRARKTKRFIELRVWEKGLVAAASAEARAKAGRSRSETCLAWCPRELRQMYRDLTKLGHRASEAKRMVLDHHENEMRKFRARLGGDVTGDSLGPIITREADPVAIVAESLDTPAEWIVGPSHEAELVAARCCVAVIMRRRGLRLSEIGERLGGRDHSTIVNLLKRWDFYVAREPALRSIAEMAA